MIAFISGVVVGAGIVTVAAIWMLRRAAKGFNW